MQRHARLTLIREAKRRTEESLQFVLEHPSGQPLTADEMLSLATNIITDSTYREALLERFNVYICGDGFTSVIKKDATLHELSVETDRADEARARALIHLLIDAMHNGIKTKGEVTGELKNG